MKLRRPKEPTAAEVEDHNRLHEPYRAWCPACVGGRGRSEYHATRDHGEDAIPVIAVDYGFMSSKSSAGGDPTEDQEEEGSTPILFARVGVDRWCEGIAVPCKGVEHTYCAQALAGAIRRARHKRILCRSDAEPAIQALIAKAAVLLREEGIETLHEQETATPTDWPKGL